MARTVEFSTRTLMIQGTGSNVGKTFLTAGFCGMFRQDGYSVSPFKARGMGSVEPIGGGYEITKSQVVQALAAGIEPEPAMCPVVMAFEGNTLEIIVRGKRLGDKEKQEFRSRLGENVLRVATESLDELRKRFGIVVMEGLGCAAEPNLIDSDVPNRMIAEYAQSPVLLVATVQNGGAFAVLEGAFAIMKRHKNAARLIKGFVINHGERQYFEEAITELQHVARRPVVGVVPYLPDHGLPDWDSDEPGTIPMKAGVEYDLVAQHVRSNIDMSTVHNIVHKQIN